MKTLFLQIAQSVVQWRQLQSDRICAQAYDLADVRTLSETTNMAAPEVAEISAGFKMAA
jgi:hypothetical protein